MIRSGLTRKKNEIDDDCSDHDKDDEK